MVKAETVMASAHREGKREGDKAGDGCVAQLQCSPRLIPQGALQYE